MATPRLLRVPLRVSVLRFGVPSCRCRARDAKQKRKTTEPDEFINRSVTNLTPATTRMEKRRRVFLFTA